MQVVTMWNWLYMHSMDLMAVFRDGDAQRVGSSRAGIYLMIINM